MGAFDDFVRMLEEQTTSKVNAQIVWVKATEVDWSSKTMTAVSLLDDLEYFDVQLGLGSIYKKPKVGTKCLVGIIENKPAASFLIEAVEVEESIYTSKDASFVINETGFVIKKGEESLKTVLNDFIDEVNKIVVIQGNTINVEKVTAIKNRLNTILTA